MINWSLPELNNESELVEYITRSATLALLLEVSASPKPGNVHRYRDFKDTRYEHFLTSAVVLSKYIRLAALRGVEVACNESRYQDILIGSLIKNSIEDIKRWHKGGNTHFGTMILFYPLTAALAIAYIKNGSWTKDNIRSEFEKVVKATTVKDSIEFYNALSYIKANWLGSLNEVGKDIAESNFKSLVNRYRLSLYDLMYESRSWDLIAYEFTSNLEISFEEGYPTLCNYFKATKDINIAIVHTFLKLLSNHPDTFIARKVGLKYTRNIKDAVKIGYQTAKDISNKARKVLLHGGLLSREGVSLIKDLDEYMAENNLNPGSIADIVATVIYIALILGLRF